MKPSFADLHLILLVLGLILSHSLIAGARVINSLEDKARLDGFNDFLADKKAFEDQRLSELKEEKKEERDWERQRLQALKDYKSERAREKEDSSDSGPEFREDEAEKWTDYQEHKQARRAYVNERNHERILQQRQVDVSEASELKLNQTSERVEWKKRKFFSSAGAGFNSEAGAGTQNPTGSSYPNNNGYWNSGAYYNEPPPPPPPPMYYDDYR